MPAAVMNGMPGDRQAEDRDDHGAAGEDHRLAGGGDRAAGRLRHRQSRRRGTRGGG